MNFDWTWIKTLTLESVYHLIQGRPHCALILSYSTIGLEIIVYPSCPPAPQRVFFKWSNFGSWIGMADPRFHGNHPPPIENVAVLYFLIEIYVIT